MRSSYLYAVLLMLATACSVQAGDLSGSDSPVAKAVANQEPDAKKQDEDKTDEADDVAEKFKALNEEMSEGLKAYSAKLRSARTSAARMAAAKANPMIELGPKFVELAKEYEGTDQAFSALITAAGRGMGDAKTEAAEMLLALVEADPDSKKSILALRTLALQGGGEAKSKAMAMLMAKTESDPDSDDAHQTYSMLAFSNGDDESKDKAIEQIFKSIKTDPKSDRSVDYLVQFATRGAGDAKSDAMDVLIDTNVNNDKMEAVMMGMSRGLPTPEAHQWLKRISENATSSKIKANAIMSRISFLDRIGSFKSFLSGADEESRKAYPAEVIEFVETDRDPQELVDLEKMLEKFITDNQSLLKRAEKELFALQNLSIGREAPEIVGLDIDGVEFKLSDYRGKVVLLDFWGDW
jgi:hypothetical protein